MKITASIKLDKDTKQKAQKLAKDLGIPLSTIINAQLKQFVRDKALVLSKAPTMSRYLEDLLGPIEKDLKKGKNVSSVVGNKKDLDAFFETL